MPWCICRRVQGLWDPGCLVGGGACTQSRERRGFSAESALLKQVWESVWENLAVAMWEDAEFYVKAHRDRFVNVCRTHVACLSFPALGRSLRRATGNGSDGLCEIFLRRSRQV